MNPADTALFIIDMHDVVLRQMENREEITRKCAGMLRVAGLLGMSVIVTEHWVSKFGHTVPEVLEAVPEGSRVIEKVRFSACSEEVLAALRATGCRGVIVAGIEAHICVLQTTLDLLEQGFEVFLLGDAIGSGEQSQVGTALTRMERCGAIRTGMVSAAYELMGSPDNEAFREVLKVVKSVLTPPKGQ